MRRVFSTIRRALWRSFEHDVFNTAKAAAYSGMLCFFPAVPVITALLALVPEGSSLAGEMRNSLESVLPPGTMDLLQATTNEHPMQSTQVILSALLLAAFAGLGLMLSLMEGFRRAYEQSREDWGFWQKQLRALMLVPMVLVPLALASLLLMFGHQIEQWMIDWAGHELRHVVLFIWRLVRWTVSVTTAVTVLAALYHFGTRQKEHWGWVLPGAVGATLMWFPATLAFGWYVTRVADYSRFYGSFAAGIATLVWLYLACFSALLGAEVNGVVCQGRLNRVAANSPKDAVSSL
jgi:membrane protein